MSSAESLWQLHVEFQPAICLANHTFLGFFFFCVCCDPYSTYSGRGNATFWARHFPFPATRRHLSRVSSWEFRVNTHFLPESLRNVNCSVLNYIIMTGFVWLPGSLPPSDHLFASLKWGMWWLHFHSLARNAHVCASHRARALDLIHENALQLFSWRTKP